MGLGSMHVSTPDRRDPPVADQRLRSGLADAPRQPPENNWATIGISKTNTTRRRTHSLFRQGSMLYELMPNMTDFTPAATHRAVRPDARRFQ